MRLKIILFFLLIAILSDVPSVFAATVFLKDGSRLEGTIVSATARTIQLHSANGTKTIDTERISRIDYSETAPADDPLPAAPIRRRAQPTEIYESPNIYEEPQLFSFDLGFASPLSKIDFSSAGGGSGDNGNSGFLIGTQYLYHTSPRLAAGIDFEYFNRSSNNSSGLLPAADTSIFGDTLLLLAVGKYTLVDHGGARPYVMAGIGTNRTSTVIDAAPSAGFVWSDTDTGETRRLFDDSRWGLASTVRLGIDFHFMEPALFSFELGWTGLSNGRVQPTQSGRDLGLDSVTGRLNALTVAGRWGWRF